MLQSLYHLAGRENLMQEPDYEPKPVAWLVRVSRQGKILGIQGTHHIPPDEQAKRKPRQRAKTFSLPREKAVTSGDKPFFLFGKSEYVFGKDPSEKRDPERLASRFRMFRDRVKECLDETGDDGVRAVWTALENIAQGDQSAPLPEEYASNDLFAFVYEADVDRLVSDREKVRDYWKGERSRMAVGGSERRQCLVSGQTFSGEVHNFPSLKRVPGGSTSGVAFVSFNKGAFQSYGWSGNENAPISREAAETCATALNRLLHPAYPDPRQPGQTLPRRNLRLSADTVVCFWSARGGGDEFCSALGGLLDANPDVVHESYRSVWRGKPVGIEEPSEFYALTLTGTQGRVIVRDWFESTVAQVSHNLALHFADLNIVRNTPKPRKTDLPPQIPLTLMFESLAPGGARDRIPSAMIAQVIRAALSGTRYPSSVLQRSVERARAEIGRDEWTDLNRRDARAALIKAVLNRRKRLFPETIRYQEVGHDMHPMNTSEGYVLGRLMAVLERIQQEAIGDVNASVVDRYFSGASAAPKSVFVRLLKNARHHVRKAKDDQQRGGFIALLDRLVDDHADRFNPEHNGFPSYLNLEQQGLFVLGYHQMRKWLWMSNEEREQWESEHPEAPRAYVWRSGR